MSARSLAVVWVLLLAIPLLSNPPVVAQTPEVLFQTGQYDAVAELAAQEVERGVWNEKWPRLLMQAQLARGRYAEAVATYEQAIRRYSSSLVLRLLAREALLHVGETERADREADEIFAVLQRPAGRFASSDNLVAAGRYFSLRREDARQILQLFYDRVRAAEPRHLEAAIATAELALEKGDFSVAAKTLSEAQRLESGDPRIDYLNSQALASSDPQAASAALLRALERNPNHVPSLLALVDAAIDRERYDEAEEQLTRVLQVNLHQPEAWAYLAVIAHLRGNYEIEALMRAAALSTWASNPEVDHLIGRKLSRSYRFAEGAAYQQRALDFDPTHPAANFQLAEDWLRLGYDDVGWELAQSVARDDPYHVVAYNLVTLYDRMKAFATIRRDGVLVKMDPREAELYGEQVLDLLSDARRVLCEKYRVDPSDPILVEIFPQQQDFAIRTFGLPGGAGFLGVCFGRVITANSPASQGETPANWQSVLWHEFCHAVTLEKTNNRMPRWLSEGISVYEERLRNPAAGESMNPQYREMLLDDRLTPVSRLSGAFLSPPSPLHLQFAYFQSSLVIDFLVERYGFDSLLGILDALADGIPINDALARSVGSIERLDQEFAEYARGIGAAWAAEADWSRDDLPNRLSSEQWAEWNQQHPDNVWGLSQLAESLIRAGRDEDALAPLERLSALGVETGRPSGSLTMLAQVYGRLGRTDDEQRVLKRIITLADDALPALRRLASLARDDGNWQALAELGEQMLAIQPLTAEVHDHLATAWERSERFDLAIRPLQALAASEPVDPAGIDFRLASAHHASGDSETATRHLIRALREAPRYRAALDLLLEIAEPPPADSPHKDQETDLPEVGEDEKPEAAESPTDEPDEPAGDQPPAAETTEDSES
ncbi:MAG: hypothetical protein EA381_05960 [Planctomycetaceae bacterium]|nr:MAG: hypothetical protein EA381_05960 [Planctomycetaceae bacterium]